MFITDTATIETLTIAYVNDAMRASISSDISMTRTDRDEAKTWRGESGRHGAKASARMQTIETIDRTLAQAITGAFYTIEEEAKAAVREHYGIDGRMVDIIKTLGEDYGSVFDVALAGLEDKAREQAAKIAARRAAELEATR